MQAARLEQGDAAKKRVLLRALERIPQSVRLWKAVVEISDVDDARVLLVSGAQRVQQGAVGAAGKCLTTRFSVCLGGCMGHGCRVCSCWGRVLWYWLCA